MRPYLQVLIITLIVTISFGQEVEIVSNGEDRSFRINLPDDTENSVPLMFILHGLGETSAFWYGPASYITN